LARTIYGEARGEPRSGKEAVANVIRNRAMNSNQSIHDVCLEKYQFSCWNLDDPNRKIITQANINDSVFQECLDIAKKCVEGKLMDNTFGSTHYHRKDYFPEWSKNYKPVVKIGDHVFFNDIPSKYKK
jgi:spore germination cell wall hydrolase CwlJ-like protein